jgi:secreted Zn-dependent insulinase-like peptidase
MVEATRRSAGGLEVSGKGPFKDEGARERLGQLTRALLSLDGRLEVVEEARAEARDSVWSELQGSKEPSPYEYASDRKKARTMAATPQYV